jgi:hypothetical protein
VLSDVPLPLRQVGEVPTGDASDLPPLKLAETSQLAQSLTSVYQKAGASPVPSVEDESTIVVICRRLIAHHTACREMSAPEFVHTDWLRITMENGLNRQKCLTLKWGTMDVRWEQQYNFMHSSDVFA